MSFDVARLAIVPVADSLLVMDRSNGRWALTERSAGRTLQRLFETNGADSDTGALRDLLLRQGVGIGPGPRADYGLSTLILKLTKVCNFGCKYCYDIEPEDSLTHMTTEVAVAAVDEALRLAPGPVSVLLHGGEPTLRFGVIRDVVTEGERLALEYGKKVQFVVQSNLSRLTPDIVEFSSAHEMYWGISFDGPAPINDRLRVLHDGSGTYRYLERALEEFPEFTRRCSVLSTITAANHHQLPMLARHFRDLGFPSWDWSLFQPIGAGRDGGCTLNYSLDTLIASWNELFEAVEAGEFHGFYLGPVMDYLNNFILGPGGNMCQREHCGAARDLLSVSYDGTIEACDCIDRKGPLANLGLIQLQTRDGLLNARNSAKAELIRSRDVRHGECGDCAWLAVCGGSCLAHAPSLHGIYVSHCRIATNAFMKIATSIAASDRLRGYWEALFRRPETVEEGARLQ